MKQFKRFGQKTLLFMLMISLLLLNAQAGDKKEVNKTFKPKEMVEIKTVSGDCVIKKGSSSEIKVQVVYTYSDDEFEVIFEEEGNTLVMKEYFLKKECNWSHHGESHWTVILPGKTKIEFKSASGDLDVNGLVNGLSVKVASGDVTAKDMMGNICIKSASGDVKIDASSGDMTVEVASGDITLSDVKGMFNIKAASSDIEANGIQFNEESSFKTVSGELQVKLFKSSTVDLSLTTVSGDVTLDYNGNPVKGYFEFKGKKGNISSDIPFDDNETHGYSPFATRYSNRGDSPRITLKVVSGDLVFKK
jgi:phage baseplate assembly protein gpV